MFRILLVEDILNTLDELRELLKEAFSDVLVETASTVEEGLDKIKVAEGRNQPFDVAILDFKLPAHKGLNPETDETLCIEIKSRMPGTLVIHITAFHEDVAVAKHITRHHTGKNTPRVELIQKSAYWPEKLLSATKSYLIEQRLGALFERQIGGSEARKAMSGAGSLTHQLAALSRDIATYWRDIDEPTKKEIRDNFEITEDEQGVHVTLLRNKQ
jgi:CheY-like chemotaxis protein